MSAAAWYPVFTHQGNELILPHRHAETEQSAYAEGVYAGLTECLILGCRFASRVIEIADPENFPNLEVWSGPIRVCVFAGPEHDKAVLAAAEPMSP